MMNVLLMLVLLAAAFMLMQEGLVTYAFLCLIVIVIMAMSGGGSSARGGGAQQAAGRPPAIPKNMYMKVKTNWKENPWVEDQGAKVGNMLDVMGRSFFRMFTGKREAGDEEDD
ncbi:Uncharacterised protein [Candidatus Norongarragalina meridionalis]|nr:Uncharacterised protein [Candidatus Norongarragalina meridionalis]